MQFKLIRFPWHYMKFQTYNLVLTVTKSPFIFYLLQVQFCKMRRAAEFVKKFVPKDYMDWQMKYFKIVGLIVPENKALRVLWWIWSPQYIFFQTIFLVVVDAISIYRVYTTNLKQAMLTFAIAMLHQLCAIRILVWFFYHQHSNKNKRVFKIINRKLNFDIFKVNNVNLSKFSKTFNKTISLTYEEIQEKWQDIGASLGNSTKHQFRFVLRIEFTDKVTDKCILVVR